MATPVSIAIRRDTAQARIQAASMTLAAAHGMGDVDLAPRHKQPEIQAAMTLEAVADFLEALAVTENEPAALPAENNPVSKPAPAKRTPRKA